MSYRQRTRDDHLANDGTPKRILSLDGGGLRGVLSLGILAKLENELRARHGADAEFRLCHYFDLIAGTSTGAIIAAALAQGWTTADLTTKYFELGTEVFERSLFRHGLLRAKYDDAKLARALQRFFGEYTTLGSDRLETGLLIVTKRLDSGSAWPVSNNPRGKYFGSRPGGVIGNGEYPLWKVVRASTAAPVFFAPEKITIAEKPDHPATVGEFIDGGASPFNNPSLQALMYATLAGYNIGWPMGEDRLLLVSVGTGRANPDVARSALAAKEGVLSLLSLMNDCADLQEVVLQWLSSGPTARAIDRELGDLGRDMLGGSPQLTYRRYNVDLREQSVKELDGSISDDVIKDLSAMDAPENMETLHTLGVRAAERDVRSDHFAQFDLPQTTK